MAKASPIRRVALSRTLRSDTTYELVLGILDYSEHVRHWRFVSAADQAFVLESEVDLGTVDGMIGRYHPTTVPTHLIEAGVAVVDTSTAGQDVRLPRVGNDDEAIGRIGAVHLLERGFRRFGFLGQQGYWFSERRGEGFRGMIEREAGRECHALVRGADPPIPPRILVRDWLARLPKPIAIMAASDQPASLLIGAAAELRLRVPDDVAVLGVDNNRWITSMASTPISSVEPDGRRVGYLAAKLLDALMAGQEPPPPQWVPPLGVVTRRSTDIVLAKDAVVSEALRFIRDHCIEAITVDDVLDVVGISRRSLEYRMRQAIGVTPQVAITQAQVERAKKLLLESDQKIGQIARLCGFHRQEGFTVTFKRVTGLTPGDYREQQKAPSRRAASSRGETMGNDHSNRT